MVVTALATYAVALRQAGRLDEAISQMQATVRFHEEHVGSNDEEYAASLNILASMLGSQGKHTQADQTFRDALATARSVFARTREPYAEETLREVFNDYANHLLRRVAPHDAGVAPTAVSLLDEAFEHVRPDKHGWLPLNLNRAESLRMTGDLPGAEAILRELVTCCEESYGNPSYELFAVLADLAAALKEQRSITPSGRSAVHHIPGRGRCWALPARWCDAGGLS